MDLSGAAFAFSSEYNYEPYIYPATDAVDVRLYKVQSTGDFLAALRSAKTNYANTGMADSQLADTAKLLQKALDALYAAKLGENLALNTTATADSVYDDMEQYNGQKTVDGDFTTRWASKANKEAAQKFYLTIDLGQAKTFNQVEWGNGSESLSDYHPNTETLDPESWVRTAWEAGMGYVVLITKHHDGFVLFDTQYTEHSVMHVPDEAARRDIVAEVAAACRKYGVKLGLYYSIWDMNWEKEHPRSDYPDRRAWDQANADYAYHQIEELMSNYGEISELWIDGGWLKETERWEYERIYHMVKELQPGCQMSVNLTIGDADPAKLQGGETIVNFPSDFRLYDGKDTANSDTDPKLFTHNGETYYLPFEGTFRIGNGWFWNRNSSAATIERSAENIWT